MKQSVFSLTAVSLSALLLLAACDSAEDRAEQHYGNAVSLIAEGDVDRAIVELRNVFQLNGRHLDARRLYAATMLELGNMREALGSYTFVSEQDPSDLESRIVIARIAAEAANWEPFDLNVTRAHEMAPDNPDVRLLWNVLQFRQALIANDTVRRNQAAEDLEAMRAEFPDDILIPRVLIENHITEERYSSALDEVDEALRIAPESRDLLQARLALLAQLGQDEAVERQLADMIEDDPADTQSKEALIRWHMSRGEADRAEAILREDATREDATTEARVTYIAFVRALRGDDDARAEIEALLTDGRDVEVLRSLRASLDFDAGRRTEAIAELESILATAEPGETSRQVKVALARMLTVTGDAVAGRQRVEEVLAEDATNVEALKLRAGWLIEQDRPDDAIQNLRVALDQAPRDPQIMTLMAGAYIRSGNRELAGEMLSLAVEASNNAPEEALRYARYLLEDGKPDVAEPILINALRLVPNNAELLVELGQVYLRQQDWPRLEQVEATLRRFETDPATAAAQSLMIARLQVQNRADEAIAELQSIVQQGGGTGAEIEIVRTHLRNGDVPAAEAFVDGLLEETPDSVLLRFLKGSLYAATDRAAEAEEVYATILAENPQQETVWRTLYTLQVSQGRLEDARATLEQGLEALPGAPNLQWALAGEYERQGNIDAAIAIYEALYEQNTDSIVIANNLASLISTYRTDAESLERAWAIARRLRGLDRPEFQDTYGWIALRRGELSEALAHLEPAAAALSGDPLVQFHFGMALARAERNDEAVAQLQRAIDLAGPADTRSQFQEARAEIERISALSSASAAD